jgi:hypothetical protein
MMKHTFLYTLTIVVIVSGLVTSAIGLFDTAGGAPYNFTNLYGDVVKIYGKGLYANDSFFRAPIFRGTDFTMLFLGCPLLIFSLIQDVRKPFLKTRLLLVSVISCFTYYAINLALGTTYNYLHLVYILLFSASFFGLIAGMMSVNFKAIQKSAARSFPYRGIYVFLILTGIALFVAWLPDIVSAMVNKRPLALIENYTTEVTYVLDMGIIAPLSFVCLYLLKQRKGMGYVLLDMLLTLCIVIGIMLPIQTLFQLKAGIELPLAAVISKIASFCLLALFAIYFKTKTAGSIAEPKENMTVKNQVSVAGL